MLGNSAALHVIVINNFYVELTLEVHNMKLIFFLLFLSNIALASKEGVLAIQTFHITSEGIGQSGPIGVSGAVNSKGKVTSFKIDAFGKKIEVPIAQLEKADLSYKNSIQMSFEHGYKELGGRTIYIVFKTDLTSSLSKEKVTFVVKENGTIEIK